MFLISVRYDTISFGVGNVGYNKTKKTPEKQIMKRTRWMLMKNSENLNKENNEHHRLAEALKLNQPLAAGYY